MLLLLIDNSARYLYIRDLDGCYYFEYQHIKNHSKIVLLNINRNPNKSDCNIK